MTGVERSEQTGAEGLGVDAVCFDDFFRRVEPVLRSALVSTFGSELGRDAAAEALRYGWEHWDRVEGLDNRTGYLFRVGERWAQRQTMRARRPLRMRASADSVVEFEPALGPALERLSTRQRQAVVLCIGYGLTHAEAAQVLGVARSSVQNHVERGLRHLRRELGTES